MIAAQYALIALGGALGAMARFGVSSWINDRASSSFPWGTFAVNLLGSILFGVIFVLVFSSVQQREALRLFALVGFMGAFTTFSTFSFETIRLIESGQPGLALTNVLASVFTCVVGAWVGMGAARYLT